MSCNDSDCEKNSDMTRLVECESCDRLFNANRSCFGNRFRCRYCGEKHYRDRVQQVSEIEKRLRTLLEGETVGAAQQKLDELNPGPNNDSRDVSAESTKLYIIRRGSGEWKIGVSVNPKQRCTNLSSHSPQEYEVHSCYDLNKPRYVERELHQRFQDANISGEWFDLPESVIDDLAAELTARCGSGMSEVYADDTVDSQVTLTTY
jgi:rRNA maturation endonuclease Nob1